MNNQEIEATIKRYNDRLLKFGISEEALGWGSKGRAKLRYQILMSRWDLNGSRILDVGCGFGWFYDYLIAAGITNLEYTGVDINPKFIELASGMRKDTNCNFLLNNLLTDSISGEFDYVVSSGIFNHKLEDNAKFIGDMLGKFNELSIKGFAVNFLSNKVKYEYEYTYHADPGSILNTCYKFSNNVLLRNDYMPFEFTIFIDKHEIIDPEKTVYQPYLKYV